ncbi:MAG: DUF1634 domain-containing protein [Isosphaeraceae bacterium]|nr:DUF1634 domain-containing protein [Isosphaeraceae bacterium]
MANANPSPARRLERWVHWALLTGLVASGLLLALGLITALASGRPRPEGPPPPLALVIRAAVRGEGVGLIDLGLLALIGTPLLRVAVLAIGWAVERQWIFVAVALTVLGLLLLSFTLGVG